MRAHRPEAGFQEYQRQFARHLRAPRQHAPPPGVAAGRMRVYAELVFGNLEGTLAACFPVCKQMLGPRRWPRLVRQFIGRHRCATPLFRQIPEEFLRFLQSDAVHDARLPPYLYSLAHYEWIELALALADVEEAPTLPGDLLSGVPALAPALALLSYPYAVQRISPRYRPRRPLPEPVRLLVFRDGSGEVRFVELNAVSLCLLDLLQQGEASGADVIARVADRLPQLPRAEVLQHGRELLRELQRLGVIVGVYQPT